MCEYCIRGKAIVKGIEPTPFGDHEQEISIYKYLLVSRVTYHGTRAVPIKYCPMCGRKLEEVDDVQPNQSR
ncbi:hypothetical protein I580_01898 [Enterococcus caccae ATCC BAA-1240]|uniref:Uncharacterized protein n=1 Tax=Enterococcus caccae ATCC BAA-1240 TaxID=1158612 RepID=R3WVH2_9ENTE|nr:hypothetical protein UC7_01597 [Enterococcus caccae ATCC BAA-1240]EOT60996.1 hypothetical protein I580_01898 [Enterococcus caccae ATCC BAA-1240]